MASLAPYVSTHPGICNVGGVALVQAAATDGLGVVDHIVPATGAVSVARHAIKHAVQGDQGGLGAGLGGAAPHQKLQGGLRGAGGSKVCGVGERRRHGCS